MGKLEVEKAVAKIRKRQDELITRTEDNYQNSGKISIGLHGSSFDVERAGIPSILAWYGGAGQRCSTCYRRISPILNSRCRCRRLAVPVLVSAHICLCLCLSWRLFEHDDGGPCWNVWIFTRSNYAFSVLARIFSPRPRCLRGSCCCSQDCPCSGGYACRTTLLTSYVPCSSPCVPNHLSVIDQNLQRTVMLT